MKKLISNYNVIDLFAGGGGLGLGFQNAGFRMVASYDNWIPAINFFKKNIKSHPIYEIDLEKKTSVEHIRKHNPDFIIGGPPCQDFSSAGKRHECQRANLTVVFAEIINDLRPDLFLMENVERAKKSRAFARASGILKEAGYGLTAAVLDASLCGVPQKRKRLFLFGELGGNDNVLIPYIIKAQRQKPMTVREYLGDSLEVDYYYRHPRSYARRGIFSVDEASPTIRGVNRPLPSGYPGHPGDPVPVSSTIRPLTTKERSLIQTFPEDFDVTGAKSEIEQVTGNAVPVKLAEFVAHRIKDYLTGKINGQPQDSTTSVSSPFVQLELFEQKANYLVKPRTKNDCESNLCF